jgi:hypothetical protein
MFDTSDGRAQMAVNKACTVLSFAGRSQFESERLQEAEGPIEARSNHLCVTILSYDSHRLRFLSWSGTLLTPSSSTEPGQFCISTKQKTPPFFFCILHEDHLHHLGHCTRASHTSRETLVRTRICSVLNPIERDVWVKREIVPSQS